MTFRRTLFAALAAALVAASIAGAAEAQTFARERLTLHGYLTQGAGAADGLSIHGIGRTGTQDYRVVALQFRYDVSDADQLLLQFTHRRFGQSVITDAEPAVGLAWGFYQRKFGPAYAKVGKVPIPRGIYNETRVVGTILPFYRAPYNFYSESFESVDGLVLGHSLALGAWGLESSAYAGSFDFKQVVNSNQTARQPVLAVSRGEHAVGGQVWLNTPIAGARVGVNALRFRIPGITPFLVGTKTDREQGRMVGTALDVTRDRYFVRGEWGRMQIGEFEYTGYYGQAGVRVHEKVSINAQADVADVESPQFVSPTAYRLNAYNYARDNAVGVNFHASPSFVLKLEGHKAKGFMFDEYVSSSAGQGAGKSTYGIVSVSVSF